MSYGATFTYTAALAFACLSTTLLVIVGASSLPECDTERGCTRSTSTPPWIRQCDKGSSTCGSSLPSPIQCDDNSGCTLANYQGTWIDSTPCKAAKAVYPSTEAELVSAVALGVKEGRKMKVVTEIGHSMTKLACPEGENGLLISTRDYVTEPVYVNKTEMLAYVDAGMQLREFVHALALKGVTIPHTPLWDGVSVGGVIATGSHGSGFFSKGSVISEYVTAVRMVVPAPPEAGYAKVIVLNSGDEALKAAKMSLGVLGVISKVTFAVMPMFKRSLSLRLAPDDHFEDQILPFSRAHDFASLFWIPSAAKVIYKEENAVSVHEEGDGANMFPLVQPMRASHIKAMRAQQEEIESSRNVAGLCLAGDKMVEHRMKTGDGYRNSAGGHFEGFPIIGYNHLMQTTGGCQVYKPFADSSSPVASNTAPSDADVEKFTDLWTCKWDPRLKGVFYHHTVAAIPFADVPSFIKDIKSLRNVNPQGMCVLNMFGGIHVRFVPGSDAYLGVPVDSAIFEVVYYRSRDKTQGRLHQDIMEEIEQIMVLKYHGRPHWGKNRNVAFQGAWKKVVSATDFVRVKAELDPDNFFSSAWSDELLGLHDTFSKVDDDHCAVDGLCFCREHWHCSPSTGYTCQHGLVYNKAQVCRLTSPLS